MDTDTVSEEMKSVYFGNVQHKSKSKSKAIPVTGHEGP
jgi:hypothetical protein